MEEEKKYDLDGQEVITDTLMKLINCYPGLSSEDTIKFSILGEDNGKAIFPVSGAMVETEKNTITGKVIQECLYPFYVIYRAAGLSEQRKASVKEWLDNLGKWLERQKIVVNNTEYRLDDYPSLTGERKFLSIKRNTPSYLDSTNENMSENWAIYISARYQNIFYKNK